MSGRAVAFITAMAVVGAGAAGADELERQAREAIAANEFRGAAALYLRLAEREPANADYLVWLGRLSSWLHEYPQAIDAYDRALAIAPHDVEALVGKATVLTWQQKFRQAERVLLEALAIDPANEEAQELQPHVVLPRPITVFVGYGHDDSSFAGVGNMRYLGATFSSQRGRLAGQYERWNKFGEGVDRAGVSATRRIGERVWIRAGATVGPGARAIARRDYSGGASRSWPNGLVVNGDYRRLVVADAHVDVASPGLEYYFANRPVWVQAAVAESWTRVAGTGQPRAANRSFLFRYHQQVAAPVVIHLGYARGNESFAALTIDQIGVFRANTLTSGGDIRLSIRCSLGLSYAFQQRSNGAAERTFAVAVSVRR